MKNKDYINATAAALRKQGVTFQIVEHPIDPDDPNSDTVASIVITSVPQLEQDIMAFFSLKKPCFFEGCEELRAKYKAEVDAIPPSCADCSKGRIISKYKDIVREYLTKTNANEPTNTGTIAVPGPDAASGDRAGWFKTVLRRTSKGVKTLFKASPGKTA